MPADYPRRGIPLRDAILSGAAPYGHCQLYQECGLLINSARFSKDVADAFCMQVSQGYDTDCFGRIAGSIMGAYFGPRDLDERWIRPFRDDLRTCLGLFHERSLSAVAWRIAELPCLTPA